MNRSIGISFVVLLSLIYCADLVLATKVCFRRPSESTKCAARGTHLDAAETAQLQVFCDQASYVFTTAGPLSEQPLDCSTLNSSSFAWISWDDFLSQVQGPIPEGGKKPYLEGNVYLGRNILHDDQVPELCRIDMHSGNCVATGGSDSVVSTDVLVQRLPLRYDLKTVKAGAWKNVTEGESVLLATTSLINRDEGTHFVQKVIPYDLEREVQFDLPGALVQGISVNVYDEAGRLGLRFDVGDAATTLISKSVPAIKRLLGRTSVGVTVTGRTERVLSKLNGDLITVFDRNDDKAVVERFTQNLVLNRIEVGVQVVQVEYGVSVKLDSTSQIKEDDFPSIEEETLPSSPDQTVELKNDRSIALFQNKDVYPGFKTYSTVGYMILCTTIIVTMFDVVRQLRNGRKMKKNAYAAVPTEVEH